MTCMIWASQALKSKIESRLGKTHNILIRVEHYSTYLGSFNTFHSIDDMIKANHGAKSNKNDKGLHTVIFTDPADFRKSWLVLDLIEKYNKLFNYIEIICPMLWWYKTYQNKGWAMMTMFGLSNLNTDIQQYPQILEGKLTPYLFGTKNKGQILRWYMMKTMCKQIMN